MLQVIAFIATLATVSSYQLSDTLPRSEIYCLAKAVYHESRGEPALGQVAVAHAVLNRVKSPRFPGTVCEVVYQPYQFTDIKHAKPDEESIYWANAVEYATLSYIGFLDDPTNGADHYYAQHKVFPHWAPHKEVTIVLANHTYLK